MKILFISHYYENSGIGQASRDYILAMDSAGLDVVPRAIKLGLANANIPDRINELAEKSSLDCDVCIQFLLPHQMRYDGSFAKCIALYDYECWRFETSGWPYILDQFDEVWVPNTMAVKQAEDSGITAPIKVIPHAVNTDRFKGPFEKVVEGGFSFYFIGEATERKNLGALIRAFHCEFAVDENVNLLIKTSKPGVSPDECRNHVSAYINNIKAGLKLYPKLSDYKSEIIITERLTDEQILNLHYSCSCFVMPSRGEAFCLPAADAIGMGKPVIATDVGGLSDLATYKVSSALAPCEGMMESFPFLYTGHEQWNNIDVYNLQHAMRLAFERKSETQLMDIEQFSYKTIGEKIKEELNASN